jgi:Fur family transcriptional regulator, ferric uptake regulator
MSCTREMAKLLQKRGFRMTAQRHAIMHILKSSGKHLSPLEIHNEARKTIPGVTETTIYRTLDFLAENGIIQPAPKGNRHLAYEIAGHNHHHLICSSCGTEVKIDPDIFRKAIKNLEKQTGYKIAAGHFTFFGICGKCGKP